MDIQDAVRGAVEACARSRISVRQVPRGFRLSFPLPADQDHLLELSYQVLPHSQDILVSDGGEFYAFLEDAGISVRSEAVAQALEEFGRLGFQKVGSDGAEELLLHTTLDEVGCVSLDFAAALAIARGSLTRENREGAPRFERLVSKKLEPLGRLLAPNKVLREGIQVPFYAPATRIIAIPVGSYGRTVNPPDVAKRQLFPLYQLAALQQKHNKPQNYRHIALVLDEYLREPEVREVVDIVAEPVPLSDIERFYRMVRNEGRDPFANLGQN